MSRRSRLGPAWVMAAVAAAGCLSGGRASVRSTDDVDGAEVVYEVGGEAAAAVAVAAESRRGSPEILPAGHVEGADGAADASAPGRFAPGPHGRLELIPSGGRVLARLSLYDGPPERGPVRRPVARKPAAAARRGAGHKAEPPEPTTDLPTGVYELELPAAELDLVLDDLDATGAFSAPERPEGGARLAVGPGAAAKEWTPEPRLDDLAERVLKEGREVPRRLPRQSSRRTGTARVRGAGA